MDHYVNPINCEGVEQWGEKNTESCVWGPESSLGLGPNELCGLGLVLIFKLLSAQAKPGSEQLLKLAMIHCLQKNFLISMLQMGKN